MLPTAASEEGWLALKSVVLRDLEEAALDELKRARVLEAEEPPSWGHVSRSEAGLNWFLSNRRIQSRREAVSLAVGLAQLLDVVSPERRRFADGLMALRAVLGDLKANICVRGLCEAAATTLTDDYDQELLLEAADALEPDAPGAALLALGLVNAHARACEQSPPAGHRDEIFDRLRALAQHYRGATIFDRRLAQSLLNRALAVRHAEEPRLAERDQRYALQDDSFAELEKLADVHIEESIFHQYLAHGLRACLESTCSSFNFRFNPEPDAMRRDALLGRLRRLEAESPHRDQIRTMVAWAELMVLNDVCLCEPGNPAPRDALVRDLVARSESPDPYPPKLWEEFGTGLVSMLEAELRTGGTANGLVERLRTLARIHPGISSNSSHLGQAAGLTRRAGEAHRARNEHQQAIDLFGAQLLIGRDLDNHALQGDALANIALELHDLGRRAEGLAGMSEAARVLQLLPDSDSATSSATRARNIVAQWEAELAV